MAMEFIAILEHGTSKLFRKVPGILRVVVVVQDRRSVRAPATSRSLAVSGGRTPAAA